MDDFVSIERVAYDFLSSPDSSKTPFVDLILRMDPILYKTTRQYKSVYYYLAEFGGINQVIGILGVLLTFTVCKTILFADLSEHADEFKLIRS